MLLIILKLSIVYLSLPLSIVYSYIDLKSAQLLQKKAAFTEQNYAENIFYSTMRLLNEN